MPSTVGAGVRIIPGVSGRRAAGEVQGLLDDLHHDVELGVVTGAVDYPFGAVLGVTVRLGPSQGGETGAAFGGQDEVDGGVGHPVQVDGLQPAPWGEVGLRGALRGQIGDEQGP